MRSILDRFRPLFYPESVALVGASNVPGKWGFGILRNLKASGFEGRILPVNRSGEPIQGIESFRSVADLPQAPDLAMIIVPPASVMSVLRDLVKKGARSVLVITGGFGETGEERAGLEREMDAVARKAGIPLIGPNCQGIMNASARLYAQILFLRSPPGPISIVSQSGNVGGSIMHYGTVNNIGFNKFCSSGNEASTRIEEVIEYFGEDPETRSIIMYVEGADHGPAFLEACRRVSLKKPIVALKGGMTEIGSRACASHTGAMAGSADVYFAAFRQAGVVPARDLDDLFHVAAGLIAHPLPRGDRVGIVTMGGGWGVLAADACARQGLKVPSLSPDTVKKLDDILADRWSRGNPVDLAATPDQDAMKKALQIVAADDSIDMIIQTNLGFGGAFKKHNERERDRDDGQRMPPEVVEYMVRRDMDLARAIVDLSREHGKPILSCTDVILGDSVRDNPTLEFMAERGITVFPTPARAARVLAGMARYGQWIRENAEDAPESRRTRAGG